MHLLVVVSKLGVHVPRKPTPGVDVMGLNVGTYRPDRVRLD